MNDRMKLTRLFAAALLATMTLGSLAVFANEDNPRPEAELIGILQSNADWMAKQEACRELRHVGTQQSIPALAALLTDETLSHIARNALEPMPFPEVDQALRDALPKTSGGARTGIVISLGEREDDQAVPLLIPLLKDADAATAQAAAGALGRIGTDDAVMALFKSGKNADTVLQNAIVDGLLAAATKLTESGNGNAAAKIDTALLKSNWTLHARLGAFHGLAYAKPRAAAKRNIDALAGDDPMLRGLAAQLVAETSGKTDTRKYVAALPGLPAEGQVALLRALGGRGDKAAHDAIVAATASDDTAVELAAIEALGQVGDENDVAPLAKLLVSDNPEVATAARLALRNLPGETVDEAIASAVEAASSDVHSALLLMLTDRTAKQAVPMAVKGLENESPGVRLAALRSLVTLGTPAEAPAIVALLTNTADVDERNAAAEALNAIAGMYGDEVLPTVLGAVDGANPDARAILLRTLGKIGSPKALDAVVAAVASPDKGVSDEAVRVLANWQSTDAAPHLLALAKGNDPARAAQAFQGYVRLAREEGDAAKKAEMLKTAMDMATTQEAKWQVLAAWGTLHTPAALDALTPQLDDPSVQKEAASAIISVAGELGKQENGRAAARDALNLVLSKIKDEAIRDRAQRALDAIPA